MIGSAKLAAAVLGTGTIANGFAVIPTGPASLQVVSGPGEIYSIANIDSLAFSTLPADTTHSILKQGISLDSVTLSCPAPATSGQSINYLVQVTYQDQDSAPVLLPYYNSANPALPFSGLGNNGLTQNTSRKGVAIVQVKAGASAVSGSQVTPAPDSGYVGLYVVTVAYGQTTITSGNIAKYAGAPLLPSGILQSMQLGDTNYALDTGTVNVYAAAYFPAITTLKDGLVLRFKAANYNTGAVTFSPNGISAAPIVGSAHTALQGFEIVPNGDVWVQWNSSIGSGAWILLDSTGGPMQVAIATQSQHAIQLSQMAAVVGGTRNSKMSVSAVSSVATLTSDEVAVKSSLGGVPFLLRSFNNNINLATTGAGGMDTGSPPNSGSVAIYAIYNPTTGVSALLAVDSTSTVAQSTYSGAFQPSGYTYSALVCVWPTSAAGQFNTGYMIDRSVFFTTTQVLNTGTQQATLTSLFSSAIPKSARSCRGYTSILSTSSPSNLAQIISGGSTLIGATSTSLTNSAANSGLVGPFSDVPLITPQTLFYTATCSAGTMTYTVYVTGYTF